MRNQLKWLKKLVPTNLFGRALLILVLPMLLSQLLIAYIFFERHWSSVERNMANSVVGDIAWLYDTYTDEYDATDSETALKKTQALAGQMNAKAIALGKAEANYTPGRGRRQFPELYKGLSERIKTPIAIYLNDDTNMVHVRLKPAGDPIDIVVSRKTLTSSTTKIFLLWMVGTSLVFTTIAILFLRNQVRPIVTLARAAEQLGLGQDVGEFKPRGASEVRRAGRAFLIMSERIRRHIQNRTEMLAGISHDLRTPLTRMKLEIELAKIDNQTRAALATDIDEMGKMIDEYLDFARGDAGEIPEPIDINLLLSDIAADYKRGRHAVHYSKSGNVEVVLRPLAIRRALTNLIDNALRYGGGVAEVTLEQSATFVRIKVTDQGPGIPNTEQETVFKPFTRLEPSRNSETGGVGLGLSIARAIAQGHGGDVTLENQKDKAGHITGLEVTLRLPKAVQPLT